MRRLGGVWPTITSFAHLTDSARRAARGKWHVRSVAAFMERLEPEVLALQRELTAGRYAPRPAFAFKIYDPKERVITAAAFRDRVVHHALIDALEPWLDRRMSLASFACRRGKGTHAAVRAARRHLRARDYFLKLDVRRFFPSLDHGVVMETLAALLKDGPALELFAVVLRSGDAPDTPDCGLPIGNLTSQWCANLVLNRLDRFIEERLRPGAYVRYMDDFVLFDDEKLRLREAEGAIERFLNERLKLSLKDSATLLAPANEGLPFLGWRIFRGTTRLKAENKRLIKSRLARRRREVERGRRTAESYVACVRSVVAHLKHGATRAMRRAWFSGACGKEAFIEARAPPPLP